MEWKDKIGSFKQIDVRGIIEKNCMDSEMMT